MKMPAKNLEPKWIDIIFFIFKHYVAHGFVLTIYNIFKRSYLRFMYTVNETIAFISIVFIAIIRGKTIHRIPRWVQMCNKILFIQLYYIVLAPLNVFLGCNSQSLVHKGP